VASFGFGFDTPILSDRSEGRPLSLENAPFHFLKSTSRAVSATCAATAPKTGETPVDRYIDPNSNRATKKDVLRYLGRGCDSPDGYPNAGPKLWVYTSIRRVPYGSYLYIDFDEKDMVKAIEWGSE
jgi:hypothetical protein